MLKLKVYSNYMFISFLIISVLCIGLGLFSIIYYSSEFKIAKFILLVLSNLVGIPLLIYSGYLNQTLYIKDDCLTLKNIYKTMVVIKKDEILKIDIQELPTYYSWIKTIYKKYICIYSKTDNEKFTRGSTNKSGNKRIQLFHSDIKYKILFDFFDKKTK